MAFRAFSRSVLACSVLSASPKVVLGCRWLLFPPPLPSYQVVACCVLLAPHCIAPWPGLYVQCVHIEVSVALLLLLLYADAGASVSTRSCKYCIHHPHGSSELPIVQPTITLSTATLLHLLALPLWCVVAQHSERAPLCLATVAILRLTPLHDAVARRRQEQSWEIRSLL